MLFFCFTRCCNPLAFRMEDFHIGLLLSSRLLHPLCRMTHSHSQKHSGCFLSIEIDCSQPLMLFFCYALYKHTQTWLEGLVVTACEYETYVFSYLLIFTFPMLLHIDPPSDYSNFGRPLQGVLAVFRVSHSFWLRSALVSQPLWCKARHTHREQHSEHRSVTQALFSRLILGKHPHPWISL